MSVEKLLRLGCILSILIIIGLGSGLWYLFRNFEVTPLADTYEQLLAENVVPYMLDNWEPLEDEDADKLLDTISSRLLHALPEPGYTYTFHLVNEPDVNALTLPGGHIVVFKGLLAEAESPEQIAAVLAHELGHAENKHVVTRTLAETGISVTLAIFTGQDARLGYEISRQLISSYFSREQEAQADAWGFALLEKAGISPRAHADFFRKIQSLHGDAEIPDWMSTHPADESRIKAAESYTLPADFKEIPLDTAGFKKLQNRIHR